MITIPRRKQKIKYSRKFACKYLEPIGDISNSLQPLCYCRERDLILGRRAYVCQVCQWYSQIDRKFSDIYEESRKIAEEKIKTDENFRNYHESGYTVIQFKNSWKLLFDHGPLGMPPLYDHGHADVLSFILSYNGEQFLIDPGTFRYFGINNHRTYFRSTSAHNTVEIDCQDQAKQISNFIWDKPYNCREKVVNHGDKFVLSAIHDGYRHLKKSVLHDRCIEIDETSIKIIDSFSGTGEHIFRMHMHFHPEADIKAGKDCYVISKNNKKIIIRCKNCNKIEAFKGSQIPFLGWCAPQYGQLIQCHTLRITKTGKPEDIFFNTEIAKR